MLSAESKNVLIVIDMKFAVVSDTHNNMANFGKIIDWLNSQKISLILHCGDICNREAMSEAQNKFKGEIKFVKGNGDYGLDEIPAHLEIELDSTPSPETPAGQSKKIFFAHFPAEAKKAAESGKYDLVFYGHTHRAWEEKINNCRMINPGETAGQFYKPTFAVYDTVTDLLELKILEKL